jgi:hypothetical protein
MIVLVSGATKTNIAHWDDPRFGFLVTPRNWGRIDAANLGKPWGADNDAFGGWTCDKSVLFTIMLNRFRHVDTTNLRFINCPDVVGCHASTLEKFEEWSEAVRAHGPVGFVAQDGARQRTMPWTRFDALFIGGTTEFKMSPQADTLIRDAKRRGKWVHVGRVNTLKRIRHFFEIGVHSIDGTAFSKWPDLWFAKAKRWLDRLSRQSTLAFS